MKMIKETFLDIFRILLISIIISVTYASQKLVIDTDAGADDAVAILLTLSAWIHNHTNYDIVAITCVYGNTEEKNVEENVLKILTAINVSNVPVYGGAQKPLMQEIIIRDYFGKDGFGDFIFTDKINIKVNNTTHAAVALVNLARQYRGKLNILAIGPLTNLAIAISLDPNFVNNVDKFYIMGGSVAGTGSVAPGVEFNFGCDPDSAFLVLNSTKNEKTVMFPRETARSSYIPTKWRINKLGSINSKIVNILNKAERISINKKYPNWRSSDAMTAAIMIWPELTHKSLMTNVSPVNDGAGRGTLLVDYSHISGKAENVKIIQDFDIKKFQNLLIFYFS